MAFKSEGLSLIINLLGTEGKKLSLFHFLFLKFRLSKPTTPKALSNFQNLNFPQKCKRKCFESLGSATIAL